MRHGVRFLLELAPSAVVVAGARLTLREPYRACDMQLDDVRRPAVRHPLWQVRRVFEADLEACWPADALPAELAAGLARPADSRIFADGSAIAGHRWKRLSFRPET